MENTTEVKSTEKDKTRRDVSLSACILVGVTVGVATSSVLIGLMSAGACIMVFCAIKEIVEEAVENGKQ